MWAKIASFMFKCPWAYTQDSVICMISKECRITRSFREMVSEPLPIQLYAGFISTTDIDDLTVTIVHTITTLRSW